jgi:WD40 repeat protein
LNRTTLLRSLTALIVFAIHEGRAQELQPRLAIAAHHGGADDAVVSADGRLLVTHGVGALRDKEVIDDESVKFWALPAGDSLTRSDFTARAIALTPDGRSLVLAKGDTIRLIDLIDQSERATFVEEGADLIALACSPDGSTLAAGWSKTGDRPGRTLAVAVLWDLRSGMRLKALSPSVGSVRELTFSPDSRLLAVATQDFPMIGDLTLWDVATGEVRATMPANGVDCVRFSPDGEHLAAGCASKIGKHSQHHVRIWDIKMAEDIDYLRHEFRVTAVAYAPDGKLLAAGSELGELNLWDTATGEIAHVLPGQSTYVHSLVFTSDGQMLISTTNDGLVKLWDLHQIKRTNGAK